jgi:hypothetical protein
MVFFFRDFLFAKLGLSLFFFPCLPPPSLLSLSFFPFLAVVGEKCLRGPGRPVRGWKFRPVFDLDRGVHVVYILGRERIVYEAAPREARQWAAIPPGS